MKKWLVFFSVIVIILSLSAKIYFDTNVFKVNKVQFYSNKLPEGSEFTIFPDPRGGIREIKQSLVPYLAEGE